MEVLIIVLLAILVVISAFISTTGLIEIKKNFKINITIKGWWLIIINLVIIALLVYQYCFNERKIRLENIKSQTNQEIRDSVLKARYDSSLLVVKSKFDSSNLETVSTVANILGKYGYKLDSTNEALVKVIKDSAKINIVLPEDPSIKFTKKSSINTGDTVQLNLRIKSWDAGSTGYNITSTLIAEDTSGKLYYNGVESLLEYDYRLPKDHSIACPLFISDSERFMRIYIRIKGTYMNSDQSKEYSVDSMYEFNLKTNEFFIIRGKLKQRILEFIKRFDNYGSL